MPNITLVSGQVHRVSQLCDFLDHPAMQAALDQIPHSMPRDVGSLGFDTGLWVGFGAVGLWSALDAFAEREGMRATTRCPTCGRRCLSARLKAAGKLDPADELTLNELDDLRNLFAHNYAGLADPEYFKKP